MNNLFNIGSFNLAIVQSPQSTSQSLNLIIIILIVVIIILITSIVISNRK